MRPAFPSLVFQTLREVKGQQACCQPRKGTNWKMEDKRRNTKLMLNRPGPGVHRHRDEDIPAGIVQPKRHLPPI